MTNDTVPGLRARVHRLESLLCETEQKAESYRIRYEQLLIRLENLVQSLGELSR